MLRTTRVTMNVKRAVLLLFALSLFFLWFSWSTPRAQAATVVSIGAGDVWRYFKGWQAPPSNWNTVGFDAAGWPTGPSGFGYGDGDDATILSDMRYNYLTVYIRRAFTVPDPGVIKQLVLSVDYDDGFVAYLNGVEIARANVSGSPSAYNTLANPPGGNHEASRGDLDPQPVAHYDISKFIYLLVPGTNVLALQGHNVKLGSSDFSLIPSLVGSDTSTSSTSSSSGTTDIFRVIVLPDTQYYSQYYPHIFTTQTKWIASNASRLNIKFVVHEGDIVNVWDSNTQWRNADASMDILDNAGIPYSVVPGDGDHAGESTTGNSTYYNTYFGTSRFSGKSWYGGSYHGNNNNYQLLTINGEGYIFISVDWCPAWDEIDWANSILAKYPNRRAILTTHGYLNDYGGRNIGVCGDTTYIWDGLIKRHANLQIVLSGHMHTQDGEAYRASTNMAGKLVHQMLADYQDYPNGGNGWLRILEFDQSQGKVHVRTYSPYLDQFDTDPSGHFSFDVNVSDSPPPPPPSSEFAYVYDESLNWANWSWGTSVDPNVSSPVFSGSKSMSVTFNKAWAGLSLHHSGFDTSPYTSLRFAIRPGGQSLSAISVSLSNSSGQPIKAVDPQGYATAAGNGWYTVSIPLTVLQAANTTITRVQLQEDTGQAQPTFYLDDLGFAS